MTRYQNSGEVYSALYVDFDNIYTRLYELDLNLARTFAANPQRWMRWLEGHALRMIYGDGVRRRILKRCCYLNPIRYHEFRPYFIRSAFQVVDCPPLTNYGKTSADIHLVMDCMDALAHPTRFDEFIILSGDADFTPLLLRIQEHARRSLVLSVGYTSPAYAAACSWRIREDWFVSQALEESREESERDEREPRTEARADERRPRAVAGLPATAGTGAEEQSLHITLPAYKRVRLVEAVRQLAAESGVAVPLPSIAQILQQEHEATPDWFGAGSLRALLGVLDISPLVFAPAGRGYIVDPDRHERPDGDEQRDDFRLKYPELYEFALKAHRLTDLPLLSPEQYKSLFGILAGEIAENGFSRTTTARNVEDRCEDEGVPADGAQIAFILEALIRGGANPAAEPAPDAARLAGTLVADAVELCKLSQLDIGPRERKLLMQWFRAGNAA
ncbi:MAG: NYN domain-containing protein [Desulfovibrio sp.]|jgi:hypothetical protein|nr:NYN domain-containing protein [Desulfovibrio sp.]